MGPFAGWFGIQDPRFRIQDTKSKYQLPANQGCILYHGSCIYLLYLSAFFFHLLAFSFLLPPFSFQLSTSSLFTFQLPTFNSQSIQNPHSKIQNRVILHPESCIRHLNTLPVPSNVEGSLPKGLPVRCSLILTVVYSLVGFH